VGELSAASGCPDYRRTRGGRRVPVTDTVGTVPHTTTETPRCEGKCCSAHPLRLVHCSVARRVAVESN